MSGRPAHSIEEIKDLLLARAGEVIARYAPAAEGAWTDADGRWWTLNPGRADRSVGSFYVWTRGAKLGKWVDHASGQHGDIIALMALAIGRDGDMAAGLAEARAYLGLRTLSPDELRRRERAAAAAKAARAEAETADREKRRRRQRAAHALWLEGQERLRGTPVDRYLREARGIDLSALGRQPRALRYLPSCRYTHTDPETGEVIEGAWPAMVALITDGRGRAVGCHRTWLALSPAGRWGKAPVPAARKVLGEVGGGAVMLWRGTGPRGGKPAALADCPPGTHVYVTEGIEDALSGVLLMPEARWIAAVSLGNMARVPLPPNVASVTLCADNDLHAEAQAVLERAVVAHRQAGRAVRVWRNADGGKDLNDALRAHLARQAGAA